MSGPSSFSPIVSTLHKHKHKVSTVKFSDFSSRYLASSGNSLIFWDLHNIIEEDTPEFTFDIEKQYGQSQINFDC